MNVFYLDSSPEIAAQYHCDKHVIKLIIEHSQLLSTAHRLLDGEPYRELSANGRRILRYRLNDERESVLYKASHINHPSAVWVRSDLNNYKWLVECTKYLLGEYTHRYGKRHACTDITEYLMAHYPKNIRNERFTEPPPAMPDYCKVLGDSVASYRRYYIMEKSRFATWKNRETPEWFKA